MRVCRRRACRGWCGSVSDRRCAEEVSLMCNLSKGIKDSGIAIGREEGQELEKKATARRLRKMGMPLELIAQSVERGEETVLKWLSEEETTG